VGDYITRIGTALGIDLDGLVKTQEQLEKEQAEAQQQQQQQMMAQMAEKAVPAVAKEGSEAVRQAVQPQEG
jgi:23S rRNA pseudoU1915 N3-methylase RlmH